MLALVLALSVYAYEIPPCGEAARALVKRVEARPITKRAALILDAFEKDAHLGCGVVKPEHWSAPVVWPKGCTAHSLAACTFDGGLDASEGLQRDVEPELYVRVQQAHVALAGAGQASASHVRLYETLLLSSAKSRGR